jgi:diguanylate cyclase (GGDEF)-like protein
MGDRALHRVGTVLNRTFRANDYIIRYAGDEFVLLMLDMTADLANVVAAKLDYINGALQKPDGCAPAMSVSAGVAFSEKGYDDDLFLRADQALYKTKEHGRCGYSFGAA